MKRRLGPLLASLLFAGSAWADAPGAELPPDPCGGVTELECIRQRLAAMEALLQAQATAGPADPGVGEAAALEAPKLLLYGFIDAGLNKAIVKETPKVGYLVSPASSFMLGNVNLYVDGRPHPDWRALIETRLTFAPHGSESFDAAGNYRRVDNRVTDLGSPSGRNRVLWSGVVVERAQMEWRAYDQFQLIVGYFLAPFGIWNVDHGTPTLISLVLPGFQVEEAIPQHQTGVQALGTFSLAPWEIGYRAYVTNGRLAGIFDNTENKAIGGRAYVRRDERRSITLGASAYLGAVDDVTKRLDFSDGQFGIARSLTTKYWEWAAGLDLAIDAGPFRWRSEALMRRVRYEDGHHEPASGPPGATQPNRFEYYGYGLAAYRLFSRFEPYVLLDAKVSSPRVGFSDLYVLFGPGLNIYFTPAVQLRFQYDTLKFVNTDGPSASDRNFQYFVTRLVIAF